MSVLRRPIEGPKQHSPEWNAIRLFDPDRERPVVFGASEAYMAVSNPLELFLLKTGRKPPVTVSEDMEVGALMEPVVLEMYHRRTGHGVVVDLPMFFHGEHSFVAASPDAIGRPPEATDEQYRNWVNTGEGNVFWGVDAKTSTDRMFLQNATADETSKYGQEGTDLVPIYTLMQMQQLSAVFNFPHVDVPVLFGRKYRCYRVERDETLINTIVSAEKELAERIIDDKPPEPNWTHPNTRQCLRILHGLTKGATIVLSEDGYDRWLNVARRKNEIKDLEADNAEDMNRILAEMQDAERALMPKGTKAIKRIYVRESVYSESDVEQARTRIGQTKRASYERMLETKVE